MPRRKAGALTDLEVQIIEIAREAPGEGWFYGYQAARKLRMTRTSDSAQSGAIYKAMARLVAADVLQTRWEAPDDSRPRRRMYRFVGGEDAAT